MAIDIAIAWLETTIALVLVFGALVMFHEFGHFIVARLVGIRVEEFALGFGPKVLTLLKRGDTEYTIHPFPLGGFVKLAGMEPGEEHIEDGFQAQSRWKRALVIASGPIASLLLAVIAFVFLGTVWGFQTDRAINRVLMVQPRTIASDIGLRAGDRILRINGERITDGREMVSAIHDRPGEKVTLLVSREGREMVKTAVPSWSITYLGARWSFMKEGGAEIEVVSPKSEAADAGLKAKDRLVSINGRRVTTGRQMTEAIEAASGDRTRLVMERERTQVEVTVEPRLQWVEWSGARWSFPGGVVAKIIDDRAAKGLELYDDLESISGSKVESGRQMLAALDDARGRSAEVSVKRGRDAELVTLSLGASSGISSGYYDAMGLLGFMPEFTLEKAGFIESIKRGLEESWLIVRLVISALAPSRISENVGGPVMIVKQTSTMVALGPYYVVRMAGLLSLSLGIINLVPIPVLDGGHLAILAVEAVRRKRLTAQQMQFAQLVGLTLIFLLVVVVLWSDIWKISQGLVPQ